MPGQPMVLDGWGYPAFGQVGRDPAGGHLAAEKLRGGVVDAAMIAFGDQRNSVLGCLLGASGPRAWGGRRNVRLPTAEPGGVQVGGDGGCSGQDAYGDRLDGCGGAGARVDAGPTGDVREGDRRAGVDAGVGGRQIGDGVGFDLADAGAGNGAGGLKVGYLAVQQDVTQLVG